MHRLLAVGRSGAGGFLPSQDAWPDAAGLQSSLSSLWPSKAITVTVGGVTQAEGWIPGTDYNGLWCRDQAYTLWHYPALQTATKRRQFINYLLANRSDGSSDPDPDGGLLPANWIIDWVESNGTKHWKGVGTSTLPHMDGIAFTVLALWTDWNATGDTSTFTANKSVIDTCLATVPRSANGCVYSDPAAFSVDYGFHDSVAKTGDCTYGTALMAWAYKMLAEIAGEGGVGDYSDLRAEAESGLTTLRRGTGFYHGSSGNNVNLDDVWATALIVAEGLVGGSDRTDSAEALRDGYLAGNLTQNGLVRHLPVGQFWVDCWATQGQYQNGGFWALPVWDCYRAVKLVDPTTAHAWVQECIDEVEAEVAASGATSSPYEWRNGGTIAAKGYTPHAALINRFV